MIVAHVLIFVMLEMELHGRPSPLICLGVLVPLSLIIPLLILPSVKGAIIGCSGPATSAMNSTISGQAWCNDIAVWPRLSRACRANRR
jgi:uncharacterized protein (DUF983 family)